MTFDRSFLGLGYLSFCNRNGNGLANDLHPTAKIQIIQVDQWTHPNVPKNGTDIFIDYRVVVITTGDDIMYTIPSFHSYPSICYQQQLASSNSSKIINQQYEHAQIIYTKQIILLYLYSRSQFGSRLLCFQLYSLNKVQC